MIKFGPSGNGESFHAEGFSSTKDTPKWLKDRALDSFEYSFGRGVTIGEASARSIGKEGKQNNIEISVHAPYYINFANSELEKGEINSIKYLLQSMTALKWFEGNRCVFHVGTEGKMPREEAVALIEQRLKRFTSIKKEAKFDDIILCPETMGKMAQIGTVSEIVRFCNLDDSFYPCIDFGHVNARTRGGLKTAEDFEAVIMELINGVGFEKTSNMHVHFSKIQYSDKGEIRHLTFSDKEYGPEFEPFAEVVYKHKLTPYIICESAGTQAEDALFMKTCFKKLGDTFNF